MYESLTIPDNYQALAPEAAYDIQGGSILAAILIGVGIAAGKEIISDWDNFKNGFMLRPEEK